MAIKWDRLTVKSQEAVQAASGHAAENGNPEVLPLHLMAALLEDREGVVIPVLEKVGVPVEQLLSGVNAAIAKLPKVQGGGQPGMSAALQKVLEQGFKEAENFKDDYVSTEHLLLALSKAKNDPVQLALAALAGMIAAPMSSVSRPDGAAFGGVCCCVMLTSRLLLPRARARPRLLPVRRELSPRGREVTTCAVIAVTHARVN